MKAIHEVMTQADTIEALGGSNNSFVKQVKCCEFCGAELEQISFPFNGTIKYVPGYKACQCEQAKAKKEEQAQAKRTEIELEKQQKAEERKKRKIQELFGNSGMSKRALRCTFENYQPTFENGDAVRICSEYVKDFDIISRENKNGLFITGSCGVGKSHIAFAVANALIEKGNSAIAMTMIDLLLKIKSSFNDEGQSEEQILKIYEDCSLLVIDDLGKEKPTEWALQMIYAIIDRRYNAMKPIIVTTNFNASELIKQFGDSSIANAIVDRLFEICQYVPIAGESFRKK